MRGTLTSRSLARLALAAVASSAGLAGAQAAGGASGPHPLLEAVADWVALDANPGHEGRAAALLAGGVWQADALGNWVVRRGSGAPRRVVACPLDRPGYVVSQISDDGYLRLHAAGAAPSHPLWDQFHEGQRVRIATRRGPVPGVAAVRSTHLWRRREADSTLANVESAWVDVGARSRAEVAALGVVLLDPVARDWPRWVYGEHVAGPAAGARAACAAVAAAARGTPTRGETVFVLSAQSSFRYAGLAAVLARLGTVDSLVLVDAGAARDDSAAGAAVRPVAFSAPHGVRVGATAVIGVRTRFPGTLAESISERDARALFAAVGAAAGVAPSEGEGTPGAEPRSEPARAAARDTLAEVARVLARFADEYAVSGHEQAMRVAVRAELPAWARERAAVDSAGNLVVAVGPDRDTAVFVAHLDEIGYEVTAISGDGVVSLRPRGGFFPSLFEGQPAYVHFDRGGGAGASALPGVFVPRERAPVRQPSAVTAWFGLDSAALAARGVRAGLSVTSYKRATRLGRSRFTARALDDRAGCTALVIALRSIDRARLTRKVIFAWSTREETALAGAAAMAATFGPAVRRVYAVDTFVSSDSPLESQRFAHAPLGQGAVLRALDNSSVTPPAEVDRALALARRLGIPVQVGTTNGGNDGSPFVRYGAVDVPLSWPGRYSHSPVETLDLADVAALARLIAALATH